MQIKFRIPQHVSVRCIYATINFQRVHQLRDKSGHFASHWFAICKFGTLRRCRYIAPKTDPVSNVIPLNPCLACQRQRFLITAPANINNSFFKLRKFLFLGFGCGSLPAQHLNDTVIALSISIQQSLRNFGSSSVSQQSVVPPPRETSISLTT